MVTHTYREIAEAISSENVEAVKLHASTVREILANVMAERLKKELSEILRQKKEYRKEAMGHMTEPKLQQHKEMREQDSPVPYEDCAFRLGMSINAVKYHCKKHGIA
ncbi:MAG: hypothetical protein OXI43_10075 [Candidatus Poribacteria bacterium]|nr:hypothetical protein [Candidatus Poribacteria bacterium]